MSESVREANKEDSESESSVSGSSRISSGSTNASCSGSTSASISSTSISTTTANRDSQATTSTSSNSSEQPKVVEYQQSLVVLSSRADARLVTEESNTQNTSDDVIQRSQPRTGQQCDTVKAIATTSRNATKTSCPSSPRFALDTRHQAQDERQSLQVSHLIHQLYLQAPSTSHSVDDSFSDMHQSLRHITMRSPGQSTAASSSTTIDTNNNKNSHLLTNTRNEISLPGLRRSNFSKSASGSRLMNNRIEAKQSRVCDCLAQNCAEKEHSNRRHFIENYYNSRTRLPTTNAMSTLNISTPLNRLSECDAITKRLMSSPIRTVNINEKLARRAQVGELGKSRRASLGTTNTITDQVSLMSFNQFNSLELGYGKVPKDDANNKIRDSHHLGSTDQQQQQQTGRSLSVCQDETSHKPRFRKSGSNHSSNLNRAVSLACESGSSKRLLTIIPLFGCDIKALEQLMKMGLVLPPPIDSAIEHILAHGINAIGIFRKSGVKSRILTLKQRIEANQDENLDEINKENKYSIYDVADLVKMWFRELRPMPIMTKDLIKLISDHIQNQQKQIPDEQAQFPSNPQQQRLLFQKEGMQPVHTGGHGDHKTGFLKLQIQMSTSNIQRALFLRAMTFFAAISSKSDTNQMTSENLAICLTPSLCATESDQTSIIVAQKALKYCIDNYLILF